MRTFIVRLQHDGGGGDWHGGERRGGGDWHGGEQHGGEVPPLRGVVDEVATGLRVTFRSAAELVTALTTALAADEHREHREN